jgi:hypothetical protein
MRQHGEEKKRKRKEGYSGNKEKRNDRKTAPE